MAAIRPWPPGRVPTRSPPVLELVLPARPDHDPHDGGHRRHTEHDNQEGRPQLIAIHIKQQDSRDLNEPATNIENGLGVFSAFNCDSVFFYAMQE